LLTDVLPAGIQGYLNPYIYVPMYVLYKFLSPIAVGAVIGGMHGLCFISAYIVARALLANWSLTAGRLTAFACATFGIINPFFLGMLGSSFSDNLTPPLILIPLAFVMLARFPDPSRLQLTDTRYYLGLLISGLAMGMSVAFKLTNCAYVLGLLVAWGFKFHFSRKDILGAIVLFGAVGIGFLIVEGEWMWRLYTEFKSPMFPFYNHIFKSDMIGEIDTNVPAWAAAHSVRDFFAYPYRWAQGIPPITEWQFTDARFAFLSTLIAGILLVRLIPPLRKKIKTISEPAYIVNRYWFIAIWSAVSYVLWIDQFGALRYLMPLTLLTGILTLLCLLKLVPSRKLAIGIWGVLAAISLITMQATYFGRVKWENSWYPVHVPEQLQVSKNTLYLKNTLSFIIPFFPKDAHFISLGYLTLQGGLPENARNMIANYQGPMRTLLLVPMQDASFYDQLKTYGLRVDPRDCVNFKGGVYPFLSCRIERISANQADYVIPSATKLDFSNSQIAWVQNINGFYGQESTGMWTNGDTAEIYLLGVLPKKFNMRINANTFMGDNAHLPFKIIIGKQEKEFTFPKDATTVDVPIMLTSGTEHKIIIKVPKPTSPHDVDPNSGDTRKLGVMLHSITIL
jgi:hypothetical protein